MKIWKQNKIIKLYRDMISNQKPLLSKIRTDLSWDYSRSNLSLNINEINDSGMSQSNSRSKNDLFEKGLKPPSPTQGKSEFNIKCTVIHSCYLLNIINNYYLHIKAFKLLKGYLF